MFKSGDKMPEVKVDFSTETTYICLPKRMNPLQSLGMCLDTRKYLKWFVKLNITEKC